MFIQYINCCVEVILFSEHDSFCVTCNERSIYVNCSQIWLSSKHQGSTDLLPIVDNKIICHFHNVGCELVVIYSLPQNPTLLTERAIDSRFKSFRRLHLVTGYVTSFPMHIKISFFSLSNRVYQTNRKSTYTTEPI